MRLLGLAFVVAGGATVAGTIVALAFRQSHCGGVYAAGVLVLLCGAGILAWQAVR